MSERTDDYVRTESPQSVAPPACLWGPSRCMDDLCRNSNVGLCGLTDDDFYDDEDESW